MSIKKSIQIFFLVGLTACSDKPSELGQKVQERLNVQKEDFESPTTRNSLDKFINSHYSWTPDAKAMVMNAYDKAVALSKIINPQHIRNAIEGSEMGFACMFSIMQDESAIDSFTSNLISSVSDMSAKLELMEKLSNAKIMVTNSVVTREHCK